MNPFWTCELYDYIQRQELFIYAIERDTNRPIRIDAEQEPDYFENYDNLTIFLEEKGKSHMYLELQTAITYLVPNSFGPRTVGPRCQRTIGSQEIWSPWTNGSQNLLVVSKSGPKSFIQFFDIWCSTFDLMDIKNLSK